MSSSSGGEVESLAREVASWASEVGVSVTLPGFLGDMGYSFVVVAVRLPRSCPDPFESSL